MGILFTLTSVLSIMKIIEVSMGESANATTEVAIPDNHQAKRRASSIKYISDAGGLVRNKASDDMMLGLSISPPSITATNIHYYQGVSQIPKRKRFDCNPAKVLNCRSTRSNDVLRKAVILEQSFGSSNGKYQQFVKQVKRECLL
ncbi:hypothetical protein DASC09_026110 [Saccharomycopsis crataegensis]|uniref:Uncharacterized protein n=1 Tax=Saccharomycopsis crataegensis TaxID=43959 RepID=A0AAV5QKU8_9ASCO|nr:hypothetical protein DASC09_026110 [Saccharomycopsis crataegensis]